MRIAFVIHFATSNLLSLVSIVYRLKEQPSSATENLLNLHNFGSKHSRGFVYVLSLFAGFEQNVFCSGYLKKKLMQAFESYRTTLNKRTQSNLCALCICVENRRTLIARMPGSRESFPSGGLQQSTLITSNNLQ